MKLYTGLIILVAAFAFACGGSSTNNSNANTNHTTTVNTTVSNTTTTVSNTSNSMSTSTANSMSNSAANSKSNSSTMSTNSSANKTVAGGQKIKGNKATKIYHLPGCPDYNSVSAANVVEFDTESAARAAGYKIAGNCK